MAEPFKTVRLENDLTVEFFDSSNRYFGDFYRVCIEVKIAIPLHAMRLSQDQAKAAAKLKSPLCFIRRLERMGVAGADVQAVKDLLIQSFLASCDSYLNAPDFAQRFLAKKLSEMPGLAYSRY